ncbi:Transcription factor [Rhizina undulata]
MTTLADEGAMVLRSLATQRSKPAHPTEPTPCKPQAARMTTEISKLRLLARTRQSTLTTGTPLTVEPKLSLKDQVLAIVSDPEREQDTLPLPSLFLHAVHGPVHEAFINAIVKITDGAMYAEGFLNEEMKLVSGGNLSITGFSDAFRKSCKLPDWYIKRRRRKYPTVVFEVGWTQLYKDLIQNAKLWLEGSKGKVRLVVIVCITEEKNLSQPQNPSCARNTSLPDPTSPPEPASSPELEIEQVKIAEAFIELWEYNPETSAAVLRDARVPVPPLPAATSFRICLGDILPPEFIPEGRTATEFYNVPLSKFRTFLEEALPDQALVRLENRQYNKRRREGDVGSD